MSNKINAFRKVVLLVITVILVSSCIPNRKFLYLQERAQMEYEPLKVITEKYVIQVNDKIQIRVQTPNPELSEYFNNSQEGQSMQNESSTGYLVDDNYNIDFPYVGNVNVKGCTLKMVKLKIEEALSSYLEDAYIDVRLVSHAFVIMGEVESPGRVSLPKEQVTIFEALALSGDLTIHAKRGSVKLLRKRNNITEVHEIDLLDEDILDSEYYYIYPNDMLYVEPMFVKKLGFGETLSYSIITSTLALYLTFLAFIR